MKKQVFILQSIDNNHRITKETDTEFWYHLQNSLLLALKDRGRLTETQYRHAAAGLKQQFLRHVKTIQKEGLL